LTTKALVTKAAAAIEAHGLLLVYPVQNRSDPPSLWSVLHPKTKMRWEWDAGGDGRVSDLWHLRERLASGRRVVYGKWFGGRATFASKRVFAAMLTEVRAVIGLEVHRSLSREASTLLEVLEDNSPQATRSLRNAAELTGRALEPTFVRAMRELWERFLIVGAGEEAEGGFPSLSIGAASLLFEDIWNDAAPGGEVDRKLLDATLARSPSFSRSFAKTMRALERGRIAPID
jgi:hypothetical protein